MFSGRLPPRQGTRVAVGPWVTAGPGRDKARPEQPEVCTRGQWQRCRCSQVPGVLGRGGGWVRRERCECPHARVNHNGEQRPRNNGQVQLSWLPSTLFGGREVDRRYRETQLFSPRFFPLPPKRGAIYTADFWGMGRGWRGEGSHLRGATSKGGK